MEIIRALVMGLILPLAVNILTEIYKDWKDQDQNKKE